MLPMLSDRRLLVLLAAGSLTTMVGGVVAPVLPEVIEQLNIDPALAGNLVSMHCLTIALFTPPLGILSDRVGALRVLIPSLLLYALFGMVGALMHNFWSLLATRALLGAASGGIASSSLGLLGRIYEGEARSQAMGYATSTLTIAGIAFPIVGGFVGANNWRLTFLLYGLGLPLAFLSYTILKTQQIRRSATTSSQTNKLLAKVLGHPETWSLLFTLALASIAMYAVVIYAPLYLKQTIGAGTLLNGVVLAFRAVGAAIISALGARRLARRLGTSKAIALGFALMAVTLITIPLLDQLRLIIPTAILFGVGFGISLPNLYSSLANLAPKELNSSVLAAGTGAGFLGQFLSPIFLGPLLNYGGLELVFYAAAVVAVVAGLLTLFGSDF